MDPPVAVDPPVVDPVVMVEPPVGVDNPAVVVGELVVVVVVGVSAKAKFEGQKSLNAICNDLKPL